MRRRPTKQMMGPFRPPLLSKNDMSSLRTTTTLPKCTYSDVFWATRGWCGCRRHDGVVVTAGYSRPRFQGLVFPVTPLAHCTCSTREKIRLGNGNEITTRRDPHRLNIFSAPVLFSITIRHCGLMQNLNNAGDMQREKKKYWSVVLDSYDIWRSRYK